MKIKPAGWFDVPGEQTGERTLAEQMRGLEAALMLAKGKSVVDYGCAEGYIAREFVRAGARYVAGYDNNPQFIRRAAAIGEGSCYFEEVNLNNGVPVKLSDIVLALAVIHKLRHPEDAAHAMARAAREWMIVRLPLGSRGQFTSKFGGRTCDLPAVMTESGFALDAELVGPRNELVQYWKRVQGNTV